MAYKETKDLNKGDHRGVVMPTGDPWLEETWRRFMEAQGVIDFPPGSPPSGPTLTDVMKKLDEINERLARLEAKGA